MMELEVVDLAGGATSAAPSLRRALEEYGFFYLVGHGVDESLQQELLTASRAFFARPLEEKLQIRMERGGRAWRGYFPLGSELTSGEADWKEGVYFGAELDDEDPRVREGLPLHGRNLFPERPPSLRPIVLRYLEAMTRLGHRVMEAVGRSLDIEPDYFYSRYTRDPIVLFRIFHYPSLDARSGWSVGEHTDYGLLTIVLQDDCGGLEVKSPAGWIAVPPRPGSFVCNIGDMLDRMTGGRLRSTPHRVRNVSGRDRFSFPFFFDPGWHSRIEPLLQGALVTEDAHERWDHASVHAFEGTYGDYLLTKVSKVFPDLRREVL